MFEYSDNNDIIVRIYNIFSAYNDYLSSMPHLLNRRLLIY